MWYDEFNATFWLTISGVIIGFCGLTARMCYKSKCKTIDCFGLHIVRDVENEEKLDEMEIQYHGEEESKDDI
jgi:hypothetical protein